MVEVVPTACVDWSLNKDKNTGKFFWWHGTYSISIWDENLKVDVPHEEATDFHVWQAFIRFQIQSVFKVCSICHHPEGNEDMMLCCYCGQTVHLGCSKGATESQMAWKPANSGFEDYMRACFFCEDERIPERTPPKRIRCNARRGVLRALSIREEYPEYILSEIESIAKHSHEPHSEEEDELLMASLRRVVTKFFQSPASCEFLTTTTRPEKGGGVGVVAAEDIPAYTVLGVYPGYLDVLSGEQSNQGRPIPKYALMTLNCADYFNVVFEELQGTFTPFINEPAETEESNCGWIQETKYNEGRLSVMTTRDIKKGEELLIGYGPLYPRSYPYKYDALTFHKVETDQDATCFALWRLLSVNESDAKLICYIGYNSSSDSYYLWETAETN
ncbi:SET domain [Trypanosoma melophagium]|uniref:SET domain n=1 Tax=Trypanosoma melophagium TaxID=715481 RepID=UPI00351A1891|nr:SET domain [Trypanosoma melophagium]